MKFKITSVFFGDLLDSYYEKEVEKIKEVLLPYCSEENDGLYIDIKYICELKSIKKLLDKCYEDFDTPAWSRISFVIDFENSEIEIYDYFKE